MEGINVVGWHAHALQEPNRFLESRPAIDLVIRVCCNNCCQPSPVLRAKIRGGGLKADALAKEFCNFAIDKRFHVGKVSQLYTKRFSV